MLQTASEARRGGYEAFAAEARAEAARQEADSAAAASSASEVVTRLMTQLAQAENQLSTAEDAAADLQAQLEERDSALRECDDEMSGLQSCMAPLRTELGRCSDACAALTQQLTCANAKLSALRAAKEALDAEAQEARQEKARQERRWRLQLQRQRSWVRTCTWQLSSCAAPRRLSRWRTPRPSSTLRRGSCSEPRHSCTEAKAMNEKLMSEFDSHELSPES